MPTAPRRPFFDLIEDWQGILVSDGYGVYQTRVNRRQTCLAHLMRTARGLAEKSPGIDFFHMDALSSAVAMKVICDLQLTLMASSLYRLLGVQVGRGYEEATDVTSSTTSLTPWD